MSPLPRSMLTRPRPLRCRCSSTVRRRRPTVRTHRELSHAVATPLLDGGGIAGGEAMLTGAAAELPLLLLLLLLLLLPLVLLPLPSPRRCAATRKQPPACTLARALARGAERGWDARGPLDSRPEATASEAAGADEQDSHDVITTKARRATSRSLLRAAYEFSARHGTRPRPRSGRAVGKRDAAWLEQRARLRFRRQAALS
eukprot:366070-Chlamydomonas_euryale.AAC.14